MAISTSVAVKDNMSAAFMGITNAINVCLGTFVDLQSATAEGINAGQMEQVHSALNEMNSSAAQFASQLNNVDNASAQIPPHLRQAGDEQNHFNSELSQGSNHADKLIKKITGFIGAYAGWQAGQKVLELSDTMTSTTARIDMMNDGLKSTEEVMDRIYASAQDARGGYIEMASVVAKLGNNAKDAFSSTDEIINFANLVQKQFAIAGASTEEASNAMLQLTQALGSGVLRGDELNSIFEQAPNLIQNIADYMGKPIGSIRDMASEGMLTADIVKNAMFAASDEVNEQFNNMPMTFSQAATGIKNAAIVAFQPFLDMLGRITQTDAFQTVADGMIDAFNTVASVAEPILSGLIEGASWVISNWSDIGPIIYGVVGAVAAYKLITEITSVVQGIMAGVTAAAAAAYGVEAAAVTGAMIAQTLFNAALQACPLLIVVTLIGIAIVWMSKWVQKVGGMKIAWMIVVDKILYGWDLLKLSFVIGYRNAQNTCDLISYAFHYAGYNVTNAMGSMKAGVLVAIEQMVNGAIGLINDFINLLNKIPGVSIDVISHVSTIGTDAVAKEATRQAAEYKNLQALKDENAKKFVERNQKNLSDTDKVLAAHQKRQDEIAKAQKEVKAEKNNKVPEFKMPKIDIPSGGAVGDIAGNTKDTAANTKKAADSLEVTEDNLVWLKDIAEREIIDRSIFRDTTVNLGGVKNTVKNMTDLDGIAEYLGNVIAEQMQTQVEGVH